MIRGITHARLQTIEADRSARTAQRPGPVESAGLRPWQIPAQRRLSSAGASGFENAYGFRATQRRIALFRLRCQLPQFQQFCETTTVAIDRWIPHIDGSGQRFLSRHFAAAFGTRIQWHPDSRSDES